MGIFSTSPAKVDVKNQTTQNGNDFQLVDTKINAAVKGMATMEYCRDIKEELISKIREHEHDTTAHITVHQIEVIIRDTVDSKLKEHLSVKFNKWTLLWTVLATIIGSIVGSLVTVWFTSFV